MKIIEHLPKLVIRSFKSTAVWKLGCMSWNVIDNVNCLSRFGKNPHFTIILSTEYKLFKV